MEDEIDVDIIEVPLSESEIDEIIAQLTELKELKEPVDIALAEDIELHLTYQEQEDEE